MTWYPGQMRRLYAILIVTLQLAACLLSGCASLSSVRPEKTEPVTTASGLNPSFWQKNVQSIWSGLQRQSLPRLRMLAQQYPDPNTQGWLDLAIISKQDSNNTPALVSHLLAWRTAHPDHPANAILPNDAALAQLQTRTPPKHIALLLPLHGPNENAGKSVRNGFFAAFYASGNHAALSFYDTNSGQSMQMLYQKALAENADRVIGPLTKPDVQALSRVGSFPAPVLALNYTTQTPPKQFYEMGLAPENEVDELARRVREAGFSHALLITPQDAYGQRVAGRLRTQWLNLGGNFADILYFDRKNNLADSIAALLHVAPDNSETDDTHQKIGNTTPNDPPTPLAERRRQDFDVIFLIAPAADARTIMPLLRYNYLGNIPVFSTSIIYTGTPAPDADRDLDGIIFCDVPLVASHQKINGSPRLFAVGQDAFLLSQELDRLRTLPNFPIYGATGALTLEAGQRIHRRLPWMKMQHGYPTPYNW